MKIENYLRHPQRMRPIGYTEPQQPTDEIYMKRCIELAKKADAAGDIPVGALIVRNGEILAEGYNTREANRATLGHAELAVIARANDALQSWRLHGCTLYVTLEPCPMCAGAIAASRIDRVVYGMQDRQSGAFGSVINLNAYPLGRKTRLTAGVCEEACRALMQHCFEKIRTRTSGQQD